MSTASLMVLILAIAALALAAIMFYQRERTRKLKTKFGPEYDRLVQREGSTRRGEAILESSDKRVGQFNIRPLSREECARFGADWRAVQEHFVDDPRRAVAQADHLINKALRLRGYPVGDFEQQAADLSVDHARVVEDYRTAHQVAMEDDRGQATTEDLRRAMQHYRNLFEHVLDTHVTNYEEARR
ncbi:MAG: putative secreted protein [Bryobacterales bacterium]|jgi:hypothetical protein|nr:putative secreted protein [Bryobacterales bacterium]